METVKNIIFDFGNVLINWDPRFLYRKIFATEKELEHFMQNLWQDEWNSNLDGGITLADNKKNMIAKYPQSRQYITAYHDRWFESLGEVNRQSVDLLAALQAAGYATYGLTNWSAETFAIVRKEHPFFNTFKGIVVSGEEKVCKPSPEIYNILLRRYGLLPQQSIFIDDRQENLDTAQQLGIKTILFAGAAQVRQELQEVGVLL